MDILTSSDVVLPCPSPGALQRRLFQPELPLDPLFYDTARRWEPTSPHTEMEPLLALTAVHAGLHPTIGPCWALSSGQQPCNRTAGRRLAFALAARAWIPHNSGRAFALVLLAKPGNHGKLDIITEARKYQSRRRRSFDFSSPSQWNRAFAAAVSKSSCSL
ncbi:hypothetical protein QL093DRAFT_2091920 [Fusarium oxysporum]|nr:hypothetical protein QL093DRAFT_2091920 [Fusarium oxysporum]KAK2487305.1 hypothetical protein H9L39_01232 [Fusarium oxysporum f. sp. albedinis]